MDEKATAVRNAYMQKWREDNRDKIREYQQRYWERKAQEQGAEQTQDTGDYNSRSIYVDELEAHIREIQLRLDRVYTIIGNMKRC